jgi:hypothetical protein
MQELNIVVLNANFASNSDMIVKLFGDEGLEVVNPLKDMYDLLVMLGVFSSKSEARKNWIRTGKEIPPGYNEFKNIGKQKKALYIWNPMKYENKSCLLFQACSLDRDCNPECEGWY